MMNNHPLTSKREWNLMSILLKWQTKHLNSNKMKKNLKMIYMKPVMTISTHSPRSLSLMKLGKVIKMSMMNRLKKAEKLKWIIMLQSSLPNCKNQHIFPVCKKIKQGSIQTSHRTTKYTCLTVRASGWEDSLTALWAI